VGLLLTNYPRSAQSGSDGLRVGLVGLGAGTLAAYGKAGDYFRVYEIDPQVVDLSRAQKPAFTFVKDSPAKIDVIIGDARLSLADEASRGQYQKLDVLVLDAFSSDAIPVHLLTREAMGLYLRHLSGPNAVMAFHLTNRSLDLSPVIVGLSNAYNLTVTEVDDSFSRWMLVSANPRMLSLPGLEEHTQPVQTSGTIPQWTDEYSNLFEVLATH
jgi:spermidine synthase